MGIHASGARERTRRWLLLAGDDARLFACDASGRVGGEESFDLESGLLRDWRGETALVLGGDYCRQFALGGIHADLPRPPLPPELPNQAMLEVEDRLYSYSRDWLSAYADAELVLPLGEWLAPELGGEQNKDGWCLLEGNWLYLGGADTFGQWPLTGAVRVSLEPQIAELPLERRFCLGSLPDGWAARHAWRPLPTGEVIAAWQKRLHK